MKNDEIQENTQNNEPPQSEGSSEKSAIKSDSVNNTSKIPEKHTQSIKAKIKDLFSNNDRTVAIFTMVLGISAIVTNLTTCWQIHSSDKTTNDMFIREDSSNAIQVRDNKIKNTLWANSMKQGDSTFQAENRAYIMCSTGSVVFPKDHENYVIFYTDFMNVGKTPANNARISIIFDSMKIEPRFNFDTVAAFTIAPYQTTHSNVFSLIGKKDIKLIQMGKMHLYVYGMMIYDDIFHHHHSTRLTVIFNTTAPAEQGNCMFVGDNTQN